MTLRDLFEKAVKDIPYPDVGATSIEQGELDDVEDDEMVEFSAEYVFTVGRLIDRDVKAGGWVELRREPDEEEIHISAFFGMAFDGNWDEPKDQILGAERALQGWYDIEKGTWEFVIDSY